MSALGGPSWSDVIAVQKDGVVRHRDPTKHAYTLGQRDERVATVEYLELVLERVVMPSDQEYRMRKIIESIKDGRHYDIEQPGGSTK